ncbi:MAG: helix-turn-helix transcriptional regulator [Candidatus Ventricola sp.]
MDTLLALLERVKDCFGVQLCVHDVSGVTYSSAALNLPYVWLQHGCEYCEAAKRCVGVKRCMLQKQLVMWKLRRNGGRSFFGVCNMGVCEYILPVERNGCLLAVIFASGLTREDAQESREKLERAAAGLQPQQREELMQSYLAFARRCDLTREMLRFLAELTRERLLSGSVGVDGAGGDPYAVEAVRQSRSGTVRAILGYIEAGLSGTITLSDLSAAFFMSEGHLCRLFRREMGMSIIAYVKRMRMQRAAQLLRESEEPVSVIAARVGVPDPNYFCRAFKSVTGLTPSEYRAAQLDGRVQGQNRL